MIALKYKIIYIFLFLDLKYWEKMTIIYMIILISRRYQKIRFILKGKRDGNGTKTGKVKRANHGKL